MRELTKSFSSFAWAMSLFGLQQTTNLLSPAKASKAFDSATKASVDQFSDLFKTTFNMGDRLQRTAVDLTFGMFTGNAWNPNNWLRMTSDAMRQSTEAATRGVQSVTSTVRQAAATASSQDTGSGCGQGCATATDSQRSGWGPMPS